MPSHGFRFAPLERVPALLSSFGAIEPENALLDDSDHPAHWPNTKLAAYLRSRGFDRQLHDGKWPQLEIAVRCHDEEYGHTWYRLDCSVCYPGDERYTWFTSKRLRHFRERLHDPIKGELSEATYCQYFSDAPFARHGGLSGTTARLGSWCGKLTRSADKGELPQELLVVLLAFLDTPRYISGATPFCMDRSLLRLAYKVEDREWLVRYSAVHALPQVVDTGDARAIAVLIDMLGDKEHRVRSAVVESLSEVVMKYDRAVHKTLGSCLEDEDPLMRRMAAEALAVVSETGDEYVCLMLEAHLDDPDKAAQRAVRESLTRLGREGVNRLRSAGKATRKSRA